MLAAILVATAFCLNMTAVSAIAGGDENTVIFNELVPNDLGNPTKYLKNVDATKIPPEALGSFAGKNKWQITAIKIGKKGEKYFLYFSAKSKKKNLSGWRSYKWYDRLNGVRSMKGTLLKWVGDKWEITPMGKSKRRHYLYPVK